MILKFKVDKQLISRTDKEQPVAKSENYLFAQFSFSSEWSPPITAIFDVNGSAYAQIIDAENKCLVPWEVIEANGFSVSVYCGERVTANKAFVKVLPTGFKPGQTPQPPTPTVYEQILNELDKKVEPSNIQAGENITIDYNGKNIIINSLGGGSGTIDYNELENKPSINGETLGGNKTLHELGIQAEGDYATSSELQNEETARQNADNDLQEQIDAITVSSDVIDVVGTYADLQNYDTQHVKANDIIKVMQDSTHSDATSYYRWVITEGIGAWVYVGSEGPYYTKAEANTTFQEKLTAGDNITIQNNVISASGARPIYTPPTPNTTVDFLDLDDGLVYDVGGDFTLAKYSGGSVVTSIDIHEGDIFSVGEYNSTDGYSDIMLICQLGLFSFQSSLSDWSRGVTVNADGLLRVLAVLKLPITTLNNVNYCDITTLPEGVYVVNESAVRLTGFANNEYVTAVKNTVVKKHNTGVQIDNTVYTGYDITTAYSLYINQAQFQAGLASKQQKNLYFQNISVVSADWIGNTFGVETFVGDGTTTAFTLDGTPTDTPTVKIEGTATTDFTYSNGVVTFTTAPTSGDEIEVTYSKAGDSGFEDWTYKADLECVGVTMAMLAEVFFGMTEANNPDYCRFCVSGADKVTIYSNDNSAITVPLVRAELVTDGAGISLSNVRTSVGNFLDTANMNVTEGTINKYTRQLFS